MPRASDPVKNKASSTLPRWVDLHFHGAWGFDFHSPNLTPESFAEFCSRLAEEGGAAAFCPTTVTAPWEELITALARLGLAIRSQWERHTFDPRAKSWRRSSSPARKQSREALALGIHLEGPFLAAPACGAHPPQALLPLSLERLETLWEASQGTIIRLTFAPEALEAALAQEPDTLIAWARKRKIALSLGHTQLSEARAKEWFDRGVTGVTHAWNALTFHHRAPGVMGATLGRKDVTVEVIGDQLHVAPSVALWVRSLQGEEGTALVSDCTPAAHTAPGTLHTMGPLLHVTRSLQDGASHLVDPSRPLQGGGLAGGGLLLSDQWTLWRDTHPEISWKESLTRTPLKALGIAPALIREILSTKS